MGTNAKDQIQGGNAEIYAIVREMDVAIPQRDRSRCFGYYMLVLAIDKRDERSVAAEAIDAQLDQGS
jgi:hypothetical protein